jgi:uncharacterized membrane protein YtjA (UPF0391 family)
MFPWTREGVANPEELSMLRWVGVFLLVAVVASLFGFGVIASASAGIAKIIFLVAAIGFVISVVMHFMANK